MHHVHIFGVLLNYNFGFCDRMHGSDRIAFVGSECRLLLIHFGVEMDLIAPRRAAGRARPPLAPCRLERAPRRAEVRPAARSGAVHDDDFALWI